MTAQDLRWNRVREIRRRGALERGRPFPVGHPRLALLYPAPYRVGMSSLGFQQVADRMSDAGLGVERAFADPGAILTEESTSPLSDFSLVAVSVAWELELPDLVRALARSGIPPLARDRTSVHPRVLAGGPLTLVNPGLLARIADAVLVGEADATAATAAAALLRDVGWRAVVQGLPGGWVPDTSAPPAPARADDALLPARSRLATPEAEFSDMHLVEANRGCGRSCTFCVMRSPGHGGRRDVPLERILASVPQDARRVGLVGAAVSDHPDLEDILLALAERGLGIGVSSLRADRIAARSGIATRLRQGGMRTLTVAADAMSERLRRSIRKGVREAHLLASARIAAAEGFEVLKLYAMIGLPGEAEEDVDEFADLVGRMAAIHRVEVALSPFVPKPHTPLAAAPFAGVTRVDARTRRLAERLRGRARLRPSSSRWAWVEARLAGAGPEATERIVEAMAEGGSFARLRRALGPDPPHWT